MHQRRRSPSRRVPATYSSIRIGECVAFAHLPRGTLTDSSLFQPLPLGGLALKSRSALPSLTRSRSSRSGNIPNELMATYYRQRASAGLLADLDCGVLRACVPLEQRHDPGRLNLKYPALPATIAPRSGQRCRTLVLKRGCR